MARMVYCNFLKRRVEGLTHQSYPGKLGKYIFDNISKYAWDQWQNKQTILINEKKLSMINFKDRKFLEEEMVNFLFKNKEILNSNIYS